MLPWVYGLTLVVLALPILYLWNVVNGDGVTWAMLYQDLFIDGFRLSDWIPPPGNRFSTNELLYFSVYSLTRNIYTTAFVISVIEALSIFYLTRWLVARICKEISVSVATETILFLIVAACLYLSYAPVYFHFFFSTTTFRFDSVFATLMLGLLIGLLRREQGRDYALLGLVITVGVLSGLKFSVFYAAAMIGGLVWVYAAGFWKKQVPVNATGRLLLAVAAFTIVAYFVFRPAIPVAEAPVFMYLSAVQNNVGIVESVANYATHIHRSIFSDNIVIQFLAVAVSLSLVSFAWQFTNELKRLITIGAGVQSEKNDSVNSFLVWYVACTLGVTFLANILYTNGAQGRYYIPAYYALVLLALVALQRSSRARGIGNSKTGVVGGFVIALAVSAYALVSFGNVNDERQRFYGASIGKCIDDNVDQHGLRYGLAGFWTARPVMMTSQRKTRVYQVSPKIEPYLWMVNRGRFVAGSQKLGPPDYNFIVTGPEPMRWVQAETARKKFGRETDSFVCGNDGTVVLVYGDDTGFSQKVRSRFAQYMETH